MHVKESYYFSHDCNASSDPKIIAMMHRYGTEGYGRYWLIVEMMSQQNDYKLKHCQWVINALAKVMECQVNEVEDFINDCITQFELFKDDGEYFWSESLIRRMEKKEEIRRKRAEAGRKGAVKRWGDSKEEAVLKDSNSDDKANHSKESKVKESKVKENKVKENKLSYAENVKMTEDEYNKLIQKYGKPATEKMIEILDNYKGANGKRYKSDYRAILSWVIKRYKEDEHKFGWTSKKDPIWDREVIAEGDYESKKALDRAFREVGI